MNQLIWMCENMMAVWFYILIAIVLGVAITAVLTADR